jgi:hypothetical protein
MVVLNIAVLRAVVIVPFLPEQLRVQRSLARRQRGPAAR